MTWGVIEGKDCLDEIASLATEILGQPRSAVELAHQIDQWSPSLPNHRIGAWTDDGRLAGLARVMRSAHDAPLTMLVWVRKEHRRRGAGSRLFEMAWPLVQGDRKPHAVGWVDASAAESLAWAGRRGFVEKSRMLRSELALSREAAESWSRAVQRLHDQGLRLTVLADEDTEAMRRRVHSVYREADADQPDVESLGLYDWESFAGDILNAWWFRPSGVFLAWDGEDLVGLTLGGPRLAADPGLYSTDFTGVVRTHRGRGISTSLKAAFALWAMDSGGRAVETMNNSLNRPILGANQRLGFRVVGGDVILHRPTA